GRALMARDMVSRDKMVNSYANAIRWSVDGVFEDLLPALDFKNTVLLYTSDHGKSFLEGAGKDTHGTIVNPPCSQANVPLFIIGDCVQPRFSSGNKELMNTRSHFQIFPTLLSLFGFEEKKVTERYGPPLWNRE